MNPKKSQIETELIKNQINNTNYGVQSFTDNEATSSNRVNGDIDVDDNKDSEPKQKLFGKSKVEPIVHNDEEKERKDDRRQS